MTGGTLPALMTLSATAGRRSFTDQLQLSSQTLLRFGGHSIAHS